ncbi:LOW QUALITY PROTEIN: hypothetical protein ACHAWF_003779 [Thalassiosira exigua]
MELPHGIFDKSASIKDYALKFLANVYGQKQRCRNEYFTSNLVDGLGFVQPKVDNCVFNRGSTIFICYTDNGTALDIDSKNLENLLVESKLKVEDISHPNNNVGVNIQQQSDGIFHFDQTTLIDQIIADCELTKSTKKEQVPTKSIKILSAHLDSPKFEGPFSYCSIMGKLNYLAQMTHPDIMYVLQSYAKYSSNPRKEHRTAVLDIVMYLKSTQTLSLKFKPDPMSQLCRQLESC